MTIAAAHGYNDSVFFMGSQMQHSGESASGKAGSKSAHVVNLDTNVQFVKGVGERLSKILGKLGIFTARDLLTHYPHRHEDRSHYRQIAEFKTGETATIRGKVLVADTTRTPRSNMLLTKVAISDDSGTATLIWFNQWYLKNRFVKLLGKEIIAYGTAQHGARGIEIVNPEWEEVSDGVDTLSSNRIVPVYPLTEGLYQGTIRRVIYGALDTLLPSVKELLPAELLDRRDLIDVACALRNIHFPESDAARQAARFRLVYEEFYLLQLALALRKQNVSVSQPGIAFISRP